jgi:hypothetical protein
LQHRIRDGVFIEIAHRGGPSEGLGNGMGSAGSGVPFCLYQAHWGRANMAGAWLNPIASWAWQENRNNERTEKRIFRPQSHPVFADWALCGVWTLCYWR